MERSAKSIGCSSGPAETSRADRMDHDASAAANLQNQPRSQGLGKSPLISSSLLGPPRLSDLLLLVPFLTRVPCWGRVHPHQRFPLHHLLVQEGCAQVVAVPGRAPHGQIIPAPGQGYLWSNRFLLAPRHPSPGPVSSSPSGTPAGTSATPAARP